jgi:hypothetical protein
MPSPVPLAALRQQLAARFPAAARPPARALATGLPALDDAAGGIPLGAVTEVVAAAPSCGVSLLWGLLLAASRAARLRAALVDAHDGFDAASFPTDLLVHLVWVRGRSVAEALAAADLLARDANLGLVLLDLRSAAPRELRRTPATAWYRLQRAAETAGLALVVATPTTTVPSAQLRLGLDRPGALADLERERAALAADLAPTVHRLRRPLAAAG